MKSQVLLPPIFFLSALVLAGCASESIYELKDVGGAALLLNKQTGSVSMLRSGKLVQLQNQGAEEDYADRPAKDMGTDPYVYNDTDGCSVSLKSEWKDGTVHYKLTILPNPVGKPFGKLSRGYLDSLQNTNSGPAIIFRDKDDFKIADVAFPKLRSVSSPVVKEKVPELASESPRAQELAGTTKDNAPTEYFGESAAQMSPCQYDQIKHWEIADLRSQQQ